MFLKCLVRGRSYTTFQKLGINETTVDYLKSNFNILQPTAAQIEFIPSILSGRDLCLRDATGTGKSFGVALTLASQPSCRSLYITPNQELATQIRHWLHQLTPPSSCQHVTVDTPARLLRNVADISQLDRIVLDEADQALRLPKRYATLRQQQKRQLHPKPAQLVLSSLLNNRAVKKPQLVVTSATLNRPLRHWLAQQGWLVDPLFVDITKGNQVLSHLSSSSLSSPSSPSSPSSLSSENISSPHEHPVQHHCLLVSNDSIRNIIPQQTDSYAALPSSLAALSQPSPSVDFEDDDDRMLESVAILHELEKDIMHNSILFVDSSISTADIQERMTSYNIYSQDIREASLSSTSPSSPSKTLWIATEFTARGVDLPSISHVFILGKPASVASYLHMAGRTGRLTSSGTVSRGKVISLIRDHGRSEGKMANMYKLMNVPVKCLEHVD